MQEAPTDGGCALFYSVLVSDDNLVSHRGVMVISLPVVMGGLIALLVETCVDGRRPAGRRGACMWHALGNRESDALDKIGVRLGRGRPPVIVQSI